MERPGIILCETQTEVEYVMKIDLAPSIICQFLHAQGFSWQKIQPVAKQRDEVIRGIFASEVSVHSADMFIFWADVLRPYT